MEIIILIIVFGLGVMYGSQYTINRVERNLERMVDKMEEEEEAQILPMTFEIMEDQKQVFAYHHTTGDFLAQGDTMEELFKRVQDRFPNKELIADKIELERVNATVTSWK